MKQGNEILALAQQQRMLLLECVLEERTKRLSPALKAMIAAHDELIRVLEKVCREGQFSDDDAMRYDAPLGCSRIVHDA
jgi:hypothetical protein